MTTPDGALAAGIAARAGEIALRSTARMYEDPFWEARFGERGRRFATEDGQHHVEHLVLALQSASAAPLLRYARWLRVVLTTRGMCSRHIEQNFTCLADTIDDAGLGGASRARALLDEAAQALRPETAEAAALFDARAAVARDAQRQFDAAHRDWRLDGDEHAYGSTADDLATLASFLADALALGRHDVLAKHAAWLQGYAVGRGRPEAYVAALLDALAEAIESAVPDEAARAAARSAVGDARRELA